MNFCTCCCCLSTAVPARAIIWRWVQKVLAPISTIITIATIRTAVCDPPSWCSRLAGLFSAAEIGAPKIFAWAPCLSRASDSPYFGWNWPLCGRNSFITRNSAKNTGSWRISGRQPEIGLALLSL